MEKEISAFLFQKAPPDARVLFSSFNYGSCYLKMNAIIIPFWKTLLFLPLSSFRPSRTIILCENKLYSHWNAEYYDTKICIISQISIANMLFFRQVYYVFRRSYSFISHPFFQIKRCYSPSSSIGNDCSLWYFYFLSFSLFFDAIYPFLAVKKPTFRLLGLPLFFC